MIKTRLKQIRTAAGLTQRQVAQRARVPLAAYEKYEQGAFLPREERRQALACALDAPVRRLWPQLDGQRPDPPESVLTVKRLRQRADVRVGDAQVSRMPTSGERIPCTVVQTGPYWFRVRWNHSGVSECYCYHALLQGELERGGTMS